ncbi:MAG: hypothetical protein ACRCW2_08630 [Cellulosilyticaceae bacterium]
MQKKKWICGVLIAIVVQAYIILGTDQLSESRPKDWLGESFKHVEEASKKLLSKKEIKVIQNQEGIVTDVFLRGTNIAIDSIRVGDPMEKILKVYPSDWVETYPNYVLILKGKEKLFGVASDYIIYRIKNNKVEEIQIGYTTYFENVMLPKSNEEAELLLQGEWLSEHNTHMKFDNGHLENNLLKDLYDYQQYKVISPNKLLISRSKDGKVEKIYLRFFVGNETLYLFDVNELGIPIRETVEEFKLR